jgi:hypothetical protein
MIGQFLLAMLKKHAGSILNPREFFFNFHWKHITAKAAKIYNQKC